MGCEVRCGDKGGGGEIYLCICACFFIDAGVLKEFHILTLQCGVKLCCDEHWGPGCVETCFGVTNLENPSFF